MPELPEVETMARDLDPLLTGATITDAWWDWPRVIRHPEPEAFVAAIRGRRVERVGRRAKWLVLDLSGDAVLAIQVKMTGQLFVLPEGTVHDQHVHLRLTLDPGPVAGGGHEGGPRWLLLRDVRKFARVGLYRRASDGSILGATDAGELFGSFGPEPLDAAFTLRAFRQRLRTRRGRLKSTLMDQTFIAGVGNIYADEALWRSRLHPLRAVDTLSARHEGRLYQALRGVLEEAVARRGSSVDDYTAPEGDGEMQAHLDAYQRTGQPCRRCGRPIRRLVLNQRGTHFCSWCQRLPASDRFGTNARLAASAARSARRGRNWSELGGPQPAD
ncbi:MAG: bifunctional DNA-formamidopyrimidine glycosylase/DNA-(apurinic or apyrimidinic site) lyase [Candidatus Limnocylindrales bacterium]